MDLVSHIDHLVIGAYDLTAGQNYVYEMFGSLPVTGGSHQTMGAHNCLLKLGPLIYLEIISIDRHIDQPKGPHWFDLDRFLPDSEPRLLTWVLRTNDIHASASVAKIKLGKIEKMNRGNLEWNITIRKDKKMPMQGIAPTLIQWQTDRHPSESLPESGCSLIRMELFHPKVNKIHKLLTSIGFQGPITISKCDEDTRPSMIAYFETPNGSRKMSSK